jgi:hypothetical protein
MALAAVLVWTWSPALAGSPGGRGHGGTSAGRGHPAATKDDIKGDKQVRSAQDAKGDQEKEIAVRAEKKDAKNETAAGKEQANKTDAKKPNNKGGKKRGLDRADEGAGEHGKQGRANAREHAAKQAGGQN